MHTHRPLIGTLHQGAGDEFPLAAHEDLHYEMRSALIFGFKYLSDVHACVVPTVSASFRIVLVVFCRDLAR